MPQGTGRPGKAVSTGNRHLGVGMPLAIVASALWMIGGSSWGYLNARGSGGCCPGNR